MDLQELVLVMAALAAVVVVEVVMRMVQVAEQEIHLL
jgi:hypothetical protein